MRLHGSPHLDIDAPGLQGWVSGPAEIACHLATAKVGLELGGVGDTRVCRRSAFGGEKSRLTPPTNVRRLI